MSKNKDDIAISVQGLYKSFSLPHEKNTSLKSSLLNVFSGGSRTYEKQKVLQDINFEIKKGEFFGIVGRNGSGKSTLLKLLAGIYSPDNGSVTVNGKLTPFIELGVGFNPELTGRENVFLNGALLGFTRQEMLGMYDEIVDFAELERFMDQKLKNYSSGMQVRLAFSIAIRAKSDILILDEVLAVGDEAFQRKCLDVFEKYKAERQTVILVTHDMEMVKRFCTQAVLVSEGRVITNGQPDRATEGYSMINQEIIDNSQVDMTPKKDKHDLKVELKNKNGKNSSRYEYGEDIFISLSWPRHKKVTDAGVMICTSIGETVYGTNTFIDNIDIKGYKVNCSLKLTVGAGKYYVVVGTFLNTPEHKVDFVYKGPHFFVNPEKQIKGVGITRLIHEWKG